MEDCSYAQFDPDAAESRAAAYSSVSAESRERLLASAEQYAQARFSVGTWKSAAIQVVQQHSSGELSPLPVISSSNTGIKESVRNWNEEFQTLLEKYQGSADISGAEALNQLVDAFTEAAESVAAVIFSELHLAPDQKSLKPISAGGVAGGVKFIRNGIFFKVASDEYNLYRSEYIAQKVGLLEFNAVATLLELRLEQPGLNFHVPLMTLLRSRGRALIASSVLPIEAVSTLRYGSRDAGVTIMKEDEEIIALMQRLGRALHLKDPSSSPVSPMIHIHYTLTDGKYRHWVGLGEQKEVYGPADIEVHRGIDNRIYVLDVARLFPPSTPDRSLPTSHLYRLLRGEFVRHHDVPLSSDAFCRMALHPSAKPNNQEIRVATQQLRTSVLSEALARITLKLDLSVYSASEAQRLVLLLHQHGVNVRLLGLMSQVATTSQTTRDFLYHEMVARLLKRHWITEVTAVALSSEAAMAESTASWLSQMVSAFPCNDWHARLSVLLPLMFDLPATDLRPLASDNLPALLERFCGLVGLRLRKDAVAPFKANDIQFGVRVRWLPVFSVAIGRAAATQAETLEGDQSEQLRLKAVSHLRRALTVYPSSVVAFRSHGAALLFLAEVSQARQETGIAVARFGEARDQFECAQFLERKQPSSITWRLSALALKGLATMMHAHTGKLALLQEAEACLVKAATLAGSDDIDTQRTNSTLGLVLMHIASAYSCTQQQGEATSAWSKCYSTRLPLTLSFVATHRSGSFESAITFAPDTAVLSNFALACTNRASFCDPLSAAGHHLKADELYGRAVACATHSAEKAMAYCMWGHLCQARLKHALMSIAKDAMFAKALSMYEEAVKVRPTLYSAWHGWSVALRHSAIKQRPAQKYATTLRAVEGLGKALDAFPSFYAGGLLRLQLLCDLVNHAQEEQLRSAHEDELLQTAERFLRDEAALHSAKDSPSTLWNRLVAVVLKRKSNPPTLQGTQGQLALLAALQPFCVAPKTWENALAPENHVSSTALQALALVSSVASKEIVADGLVALIVKHGCLLSPKTCVTALTIVHACVIDMTAGLQLHSARGLLAELIKLLLSAGHIQLPPTSLLVLYASTDHLLQLGEEGVPSDVQPAQLGSALLTDVSSAVQICNVPLALQIGKLLSRFAALGYQGVLVDSPQTLQAMIDCWFLRDAAAVEWIINARVAGSDHLFAALVRLLVPYMGDTSMEPVLRKELHRLVLRLTELAPDYALASLYTTADFARLFTGVSTDTAEVLALIAHLVDRGVALAVLHEKVAAVLHFVTQFCNEATLMAKAQLLLSGMPAVPLLLQSLAKSECTLMCTGEHAIVQTLLHCVTCGLVNGLVACAACATSCHEGHELSAPLLGEGFCDCRSTCGEKCVASKLQPEGVGVKPFLLLRGV